MKAKKIQNKISTIIVAAIIIVAVVNAASGIVITYISTVKSLKSSIVETADIAALAAQNMITTYTYTVSEIATHSVFTEENSTPAQKQALIDEKITAYYMRDGGYAGADGKDTVNGRDVSAEPYFQKAMAGQSYMSAPYITENRKDCYIVVSAPVMRGKSIVGVVYFYCDNLILQSIIENIAIGEQGDAYILDGTGTKIAYKDMESVFNQENLITDAQEKGMSSGIKELVQIEQKMVAGETGVEEYHSNGGYIQSYTPIPHTDGWSIAVTVSRSEFMFSAVTGIFVQVAELVVIILLGLWIAKKIGTAIAMPIQQCTERLKLLAAGDFHSPLPKITSDDETKIIAEAIEKLTQILHNVLDEIGQTLEQIASGNLTKQKEQVDYPGDFAVLQSYFNRIYQALNETMNGIVYAANQVSGGAEQMANASYSLAEGARGQDTSVELLAEDIAQLSRQISYATEEAENASQVSTAAKEQLMEGIDTMKSLIEAVQEIEGKSGEISEIIKTIEGISSKTNILALNASIEASRGGEAGKGFAVIAESIRELAGKTAAATKSTSELIEDTVLATRKGAEVAGLTSEELKKVIQSSEESVLYIRKIAEKMQMQSEAIIRIRNHMDEISSVVGSNTAVSEQSSAMAEKLSGQADAMKELIAQFKLERD